MCPHDSERPRQVRGPDGPTLTAVECGTVKERCWKVFCDFCRRYHHHAPSPGHRVAHCFSERSPYWQTGYYIAPPEPSAA